MLELRDHVGGKSNQVIAIRRPGNKGRRIRLIRRELKRSLR